MAPQISWHRGGGELAAPATMEAFRAAAARGAEWIEVDLRRTADGVLVCVHDPVIPGLGEVASLSYHRLAAEERGRVIRWEGFLEVLDEEEPTGVTSVHLDLKEIGYERDALAGLMARGRRFLVTSLEDESIAAVRRVAPDAPALLTLGRSARSIPPRQAAAMRAGELVPGGRLRRCDATGVAAHFLLATAPLRSWCRRHQLSMLVWTVDSTAALERWLARTDVDIVTTNRPLAAGKVRADLVRAAR